MQYHRSVAFFLMVVFAVGAAGCWQTKPDLRVDTKTGDALNGGPQVIQELGPNAKLVTGEKATTVEDDPAGDTSAATAEDKTGAVAVKVEY